MADEKQAIPPPPFQRVPKRPRGRRRDPLTREAIVAAAIKVLDAEGLDGFSMRRVAQQLDTGAASLYWHVGSKDGLLDLVFDEWIGEQIEAIPEPNPERWQEQFKDVARGMRATVHRHRGVVEVSIGRIPMGPNALRFSERIMAILRAGGLPDELAVQGFLLMTSLVNGFTMDETGFAEEAVETAPPADQAAQIVSGYLGSLPRQQFPNLIELAGHFANTDQDARFELLLDLFVGGLAARAKAESSQSS